MPIVLSSDARRAWSSRPTLAAAFVLLFFLQATLFAGAAAAQEFLGPTSPLTGYEAPGIQQGDFLIKQSLSFGLAYDSNILQSHSHGIQDFIFFVSPTVDITRDGGQHTEELLVSATNATYFKSENDDYTDVYVRANETYLLSAANQIVFTASFSDGYQRRIVTNFDLVGDAASPIHELIFLGSLGYKHTGSNYEAGVTITTSAERFDDVLSTTGTLLDETIYNENDLLLDSFFRIQLSSRVRNEMLFQAADFEYQDQFRNYTQWRAADAIMVDLTSKVSMRLLAGLKEQDLYNVTSAHLGLLAEYEAQGNWSPTQLLSLFVKTGYHDLGVDYLNGIGNVFNSGGYGIYYSFGGSYLVWRNLNFTTAFSIEDRYLGGTQGVQEDLNYKAAFTYELNSYAGVSLMYNSVQWTTSKLEQYNFNENIFQTSFNLRF